ncbi:hypothetical protein CONCODRAFT_80333 [Conidiobolus coronatus NRRL 28638]|uniref:GATA-domain-containing protein n=1 Tax=Conidiobolus coronatus (strain ATCC 28846 / CBS 209.66 / NRRL 28638) TaxID=796925 RepID=A0A137NW29_CONC2|nr:hypothetical protein CONCODRAFT_80333 [Conidiobolus coronatus NRRL 28638]|eukprot:KXN66976.1 hypothetical protein CONCODRAFT_80333 [Conidiobolus coronatus NRRL 28638]
MQTNESSPIENNFKRVKLSNNTNQSEFSSYTTSESTLEVPPSSSINTTNPSSKPHKSVTFNNYQNILNYSPPLPLPSDKNKNANMDNTTNYTSSNEGGSSNSMTSNDNQASISNASYQDTNTDSSNTDSSSSGSKSKSSSSSSTIIPNNFFHVLSPMGTILCCSLSCLELTGYRSSELIGQQITKFIYYEDLELFKQKFFYNSNDSEFSLCYRFEKKESGYILFEARRLSYLVEDNKIADISQLNLGSDRNSREIQISKEFQNYPKEKCFFVMAIPYFSEMELTKSLIDKLKQERKSLHKKLQYYDKLDKKLGLSPMASNSSVSDTLCNSTNSSSESSTNQSQSEDSKLDTNPKKKIPTKDHLPCTQCGTTEAPEWRKGPMGPKTLCNACGIRYFRDQSKQRSVSKVAKAVDGSQPMRFISIQPKPQT